MATKSVSPRRKNGNDVYEYQLYLDPALYTANAIDAIKKTGKHI
ncbi:hypothetical protein [Mycobacteroides chelonae]|jgi:hypothetical protein